MNSLSWRIQVELDLCANCDRWREEHYNRSGIFIADRLDPPCVEYQGMPAPDDRRKNKDRELAKARGAATKPSGS